MDALVFLIANRHWLLLGAILVFGGLFARDAWRLFRKLQSGGPAARSDQPLERTRGWLLHVIGQGRLLRRPYAGWMHAMIFWGFLVITVSTVDQFAQGLRLDPIADLIGLVTNTGAFRFVLDAFYVLVLTGIAMALYRRLRTRPWYLNLSRDALIILSMITTLMVTALVAEGAWFTTSGPLAVADCLERATQGFARAACSEIAVPPGSEWAFAGLGLSLAMAPLGTLNNYWISVVGQSLHLVTVLGFLAYLPHSKHMHIVTAPFNVWLRTLEPRGKLPYIDVEKAIEEEAPLGISSLEHLSWKDLLDTYTCTECGHCTSVCPASISGKPLSPKDIILDLRDTFLEHRPEHRPLKVEAAVDGSGRLVGDIITDDELWDCTTCRACMDACPVFIEHVPKIVGMRRHLAMEESRFGKDVQTLFENLEATGNPWRFPRAQRTAWAEGLNVPTLEEAPEAEVLYWVGCSGSYDQRSQKVAQSLARLMQRAGLKFAILGTAETCTGDPARRTGNEYLYQQLVQENLPNLDRARAAGLKKILTSCPHCFNALGTEYADFGGHYEVVHHTQFLSDLVESGRLTPTTVKEEIIAYHDPCYLGRYHDVYDEPRAVLDAIPGVNMREIAPCREKAMCCGAGGGHAFMEETRGKRINHVRLEQALEAEPERLATACPYCLMMFEDATATKGISDRLPVQDVAEILEASLAVQESETKDDGPRI